MKTTAIQGRFCPANPHKYTGNVKKITYRSLWERRFMLYCDRSDQIVSWSSEELHIPYVSPKDDRWHNYYPDFLVEARDGRTIMVEIKPQFQWKWDINKAKWESARQLCKTNGWQFMVLGKKELYGK
jgi:hypothetical protein